ncbi:hypothetical protein EZV62_008801 [Acer yangbiense]|uniref:Uncharacterized protein n=1 Tax=Acer yangbiense TaxID=1000413 RepID=A0A5C7IGE5_9ROSI|nr:hypothetical protein EZV62_008801 [Acer yangbiense]
MEDNLAANGVEASLRQLLYASSCDRIMCTNEIFSTILIPLMPEKRLMMSFALRPCLLSSVNGDGDGAAAGISRIDIEYLNIIYDIISFLHFLGSATICFNSRTTNSFADKLAKMGSSSCSFFFLSCAVLGCSFACSWQEEIMFWLGFCVVWVLVVVVFIVGFSLAVALFSGLALLFGASVLG